MKILIKYPTRQRPELFKQAIKNIRETIGDVEYKILVSIDCGDETMETDDVKEVLNTLQVERGNSHNKIDAINRDMIVAGEWDLLVNMSDDMYFIKKDWGKLLIEKIEKDFKGSLDCYLHFNDGFIGKTVCTMQIMGREYFERTGTIYPPIYKTIYADAEAMFVAMLLGKHRYYDEIIYEHRHPCNGFQNSDPLYDRNNQGAGDDQTIYERRRNKNFYVSHPETIPTDLLPFQPRGVSK